MTRTDDTALHALREARAALGVRGGTARSPRTNRSEPPSLARELALTLDALTALLRTTGPHAVPHRPSECDLHAVVQHLEAAAGAALPDAGIASSATEPDVIDMFPAPGLKGAQSRAERTPWGDGPDPQPA